MSEEVSNIVIREENVLEKFEDGVLVERITVVDGTIVKEETFNGSN